MILSYHFRSHEFDSSDKPGTGDKMNLIFISKLEQARTYAGVQFRITSGYRTKEHNQKVGGKSNSAHLSGHAADIFCIESNQRYHIIRGLLQAGFNRIGIGPSFVHVDDEPGKPDDVIWTY